MERILELKNKIRDTQAKIVALNSAKKSLQNNSNHHFHKLDDKAFIEALVEEEAKSVANIEKQYQNKLNSSHKIYHKISPQFSSFFEIEPICKAETSFNAKFEAPRQSLLGHTDSNSLFASISENLQDFKVGDFVIILFHFDRNFFWKPTVFPPASTSKKALFATRTPHRPNPIGQSIGKIESIEGDKVMISGTDLLNGTPILSIRKYTELDCHPEATSGWREFEDNIPLFYENGEKLFDVVFDEIALKQLEIAQQRFDKTDIKTFIVSDLERSPLKHHNHRLGDKQRGGDGLYYKAVGSFKVHYDVDSKTVQVKYFSSSLPQAVLQSDTEEARVHSKLLGLNL